MAPSVQSTVSKPATRRTRRLPKVRLDILDDEDDFFPPPRRRKLQKDVLLYDDIDLLSDEW